MTVPFNTLSSNIRVPLFYAEMDASQANISQDDLASLLIGQKLATGTAEADKPVLVSSLNDAVELCGRGSMLARMFKAYRDADPMGEIYILPLAEPVDGVAATGTITLTGDVTEAGTLTIWIAGQRVKVGVAADDTLAEIAAALAAKIEATTDLPVGATAANGIVTLTCRWKGTTGNDITILPNYRGLAGGEKTPAGLAVAVAAMHGGSDAPDLTAAIAAMGDEAYDFIACPFSDATSLDALKAEMEDTAGRWSPLRQLYGHVYSSTRGTVAELTAIGDARNDQHVTIAGMEKGAPSPCWEYAASYAARNAVFIKVDPARPTQTGLLNNILPASAGGRFTLSDRQTLLNHGIATSYTSGGVVRIERAVTAYTSNLWGQDDTSYLDSETLHTSAYVLRRLRNVVTSKYARHKLADDGTSYSTGAAIVTPKVVRGELIALYRQMERDGIVENAEAFKEALIVERNENDANRLDVLFAPDYVNQLRVFAVLNQFRLQY